jgi:hypothetical protein
MYAKYTRTKRIPYLIALWHYEDDIFLSFSWKCLKTVRFSTDYCSGKCVPIRRVKWNRYISYIDRRWKILVYLKMNLLDAWAICFLKGKPLKCARFFNEINILSILWQSVISSYKTEQFLDQIECILGFLMYPSFECQG